MWRINVSNVGIGRNGLRPSCEPANAAQAMNSAARILHLQPAILLRGVEKQFPAQCDCPHRPERAFAGCKKEGLLAGEVETRESGEISGMSSTVNISHIVVDGRGLNV